MDGRVPVLTLCHVVIRPEQRIPCIRAQGHERSALIYPMSDQHDILPDILPNIL